MEIIFVDTSFFLQVRDARELPWSDITGAEDIVLLVCRTVQEEIDRLKQDGNNRRSRRARKAASILRAMVQSADGLHMIRESSPRVVMRFAPTLDPTRTKPVSLDVSRADDRIIEEILAYSHAQADTSVYLLTNDTGPMLTARAHGLGYIPVPEQWMLEPEPDERDKSVQELKRRVDLLERAHPVVEISASDSDDNVISDLNCDLDLFTPLSELSLANIMQEIEGRCPPERTTASSGWETSLRSTALASGRRYSPPTDNEIEEYFGKTYPNWLATVKTIVRNLPDRLNQRLRRFELIFNLANTGTVPGLNVLVEFEARGGVLLCRLDQEQNNGRNPPIHIPLPPKFPKGVWTSINGGLWPSHAPPLEPFGPVDFRMPETYRPKPRDRNAFYWKDYSEKPTEYLSLICEEFRHQQDPYSISILVILPEQGIEASIISCKCSASNLPEPKVLRLPLRFRRSSVDSEPEARRLISELTSTQGVAHLEGEDLGRA